jgi:hypothetical protein
VPLEFYLLKYVELVVAPFQQFGKVWLGILPLYVSVLVGEVYVNKVTFGHAVRNGFVMLWAALSWCVHLSQTSKLGYLFSSWKITAWIVTAICIGLAVFTIVLGVRKKDRALSEILGHTRFSGYFLILLYPMQAGLVKWNWPSLAAVLIFALPTWFLLYIAGRLLKMAIK